MKMINEMMKMGYLIILLMTGVCGITAANTLLSAPESNTIRVIIIGAHPDDCEYSAGGLAVLFAQAGHAVKFVSLTNGDKGHHQMGGAQLVNRRIKETLEAGKRLGVDYEVLDNHDGELMPTLENRHQVIRMIREWKADIVITCRPNDYHPDHRNTSILVQDAAYLVAVPNISSSVAALEKNPLFLYVRDYFTRPNAFTPDIVVDITSVYARKIDGFDAHESQFYEWLPWIDKVADQVPSNRDDRRKWLTDYYTENITPEMQKALNKWYGEGYADKVGHAEAFEICEYGMQPTDEDIRRLFPMLGVAGK